MKNNQPKMINQLHLIYPLIIAAISMVSLSSFYYGGGIKAGEMVSFASTLSSIILSVIAIIMTIVDVAGQRNTVSDLKETADKLEKNLIKTNNGISEISDLKDQLLVSMNNIVKSNLEVTNEIIELKEKYSKIQEQGMESKSNTDILADLDTLSNKIKMNNKIIVPGHFQNGSYIKSHVRTYNEEKNQGVKVEIEVPVGFNGENLDALVNNIINNFNVSEIEMPQLQNGLLTIKFIPRYEWDPVIFRNICKAHNCTLKTKTQY
ncbi:hypothetical protein [Peribacillus alkalitolerans]|uniref:hypothetical protein n=1 Tax=Peribacillus alkalitolerans TaxID=1550385 RepID=UPI0013D44A0C|nr:hypothetical protein [Peribacillus alkalitolerans]